MADERLEVIVLTNTIEDYEKCNQKIIKNGYDPGNFNFFEKGPYKVYTKKHVFSGISFFEKLMVYYPNARLYSYPFDYRLVINIEPENVEPKNKRKLHPRENLVKVESFDYFDKNFENMKGDFITSRIEIIEDVLKFSKTESQMIFDIYNELVLKNPLYLELDVKNSGKDRRAEINKFDNGIEENELECNDPNKIYCWGQIHYKLKIFNAKKKGLIKGFEVSALWPSE